jgi:glyoxylase-like metal-dependent hydrolase (beta-lactamase superfamily II)
VRAPGHTTYADLKASIMDKLLKLAPETRIHPGHTEPTTVGEELEHNRFVRIWRGLDPEGAEACRALGQPATLILLGDDYDGGHKAWIRWPDGSDDIVPGSRVERAEAP